MWIILPQGFLSIVHKAPCQPDELLVRARVKQHLTTLFPAAAIVESDGTDYRYRAIVKRDEVAVFLAQQAYTIDYRNFKDQVREHRFHDALMGVWSVLAKLQPFGAYGRRRGAQRQGNLFRDAVDWELDRFSVR